MRKNRTTLSDEVKEAGVSIGYGLFAVVALVTTLIVIVFSVVWESVAWVISFAQRRQQPAGPHMTE